MSSNSKTIIAFDFGTKSIGSTVGQEITGTARAELFEMGGYKALSKGNIDCNLQW